MNMFKFKHRLNMFLDRYRDASYYRPIFILSPPRSGSTLLFEIMWKFQELYHLDSEADYIWWQYFPYSTKNMFSDYIAPDKITVDLVDNIRKQTYTAISNKYISNNASYKYPKLSYGSRQIRYLDKTIANCFHLKFIEKAFPTADFIFLIRDPRANISSMIEGWPYADRFGKAQLTPEILKIPKVKISHWTYPAPPGWQEIISKPLHEICAWSWEQHVTYVQAFLKNNKRYIVIRYEDLVSDPVKTMRHIASHLNLEISDELIKYSMKPQLSFTTVSEPARDKWKNMYKREIESILPLISSTAMSLGYSL